MLSFANLRQNSTRWERTSLPTYGNQTNIFNKRESRKHVEFYFKLECRFTVVLLHFIWVQSVDENIFFSHVMTTSHWSTDFREKCFRFYYEWTSGVDAVVFGFFFWPMIWLNVFINSKRDNFLISVFDGPSAKLKHGNINFSMSEIRYWILISPMMRFYRVKYPHLFITDPSCQHYSLKGIY